MACKEHNVGSPYKIRNNFPRTPYYLPNSSTAPKTVFGILRQSPGVFAALPLILQSSACLLAAEYDSQPPTTNMGRERGKVDWLDLWKTCPAIQGD